jgi:hypothetical protein
MFKLFFLKIRFVGIIFIVTLFMNCNKEEPIPSYIHIDKIEFTTAYTTQGSNSHKIIDVWIYIDDQFLGAYEYPCTIPVLMQGTHTLKILLGIKENGISETRIPYPFYDKYEEVLVFTPGQVSTISPSINYSKGAKFSWIEDFEGASFGICNASGSHDTVMQLAKNPLDVFEKIGSGGVSLNSAMSSYLSMSCDKFVLPQAGAPVFLEFNYKCNTDFNVGIVGYSSSNNIEYQGISLSLRPSTGWNKVYVNLTKEVSGATTSTKFGVFFSMLGKDSPSSFFLDNVKLIN